MKNHGQSVDKPSVQLYANNTENRISFKIKNGYTLELLMPETMTLLGSTENKMTKDKNDENMPDLKLQKQHWFIVILLIMIINKIQECYIRLFQINRLLAY